MDYPLISVIIPIYNMELYLERCLDSVINNTYRNLEIICIDDGSTDHSLEILRRYEANDPRIVVIAKENGGVSSARNAGLDRMTGEYVTFIDSDDFVHPQYVELMFRALHDTGKYIVICGFQQVEEKTIVHPETFYYTSENVLVASFMRIFKEHQLRAYSGGRLIRSNLANNVRFMPEIHYGEDTVYFAEICDNAPMAEAAVISYPLYYYYQREGSLTGSASLAQQLQYTKVFARKLDNAGDRAEKYLDLVIRDCLSLRYLSTHILPDQDTARECSKMLKAMQKRLWITGTYSLKEKIGFSSFIHFPGLYWLHRIIRDPSMWKWEKTEKTKRRDAGKYARASAKK